MDNISGEYAASPVKISFFPVSYSLFQYSQSYGNAPGIPPQYTFTNSLVLTTNTTNAPADSCSAAYLNLHLTGLNPSATQVAASIQNIYGNYPDYSSDVATLSNGKLVNGTADLTLSINNIAYAASLSTPETEAVNVTIFNDINQVLLPETVKLTASVSSLRNSYPLVKDATFITLSGNATMLFVPSAYVPYNLNGITNAIEAAYYTITAPSGITPSNIGVYILNATNSGNGTNIRYCGSATGLAISTASSSTNTGQNINQMVLDLSKLVPMCNANGAGLSNPNQLQAGIPILFVVGGGPSASNANAYSPLNITADGYSLFNYGGQIYIKRLATEVISGNPSVGTTGGSEASYAH